MSPLKDYKIWSIQLYLASEISHRNVAAFWEPIIRMIIPRQERRLIGVSCLTYLAIIAYMHYTSNQHVQRATLMSILRVKSSQWTCVICHISAAALGSGGVPRSIVDTTRRAPARHWSRLLIDAYQVYINAPNWPWQVLVIFSGSLRTLISRARVRGVLPVLFVGGQLRLWCAVSTLLVMSVTRGVDTMTTH